MQRLTLAYRDTDRLPVILAIHEMAQRHYDLDVRIARIKGAAAYEAAVFDGSADVIIEHLEYLYEQAAKGKKVTFFCAPSKGGGLELVVRQPLQSVEELRGRTMAVRSHGQPYAVTLWLRMMGLESEVATVIVHDDEVGRWGQWKKVLTGECVATFISPLYLEPALAAGLKVLPVPEIPIVGHFAQACLSEFASKEPAIMTTYVKGVLHALAWLTTRPDEARATLAEDLKAGMNLASDAELKRHFDPVVHGLKTKPYPSPDAITNTYEIATLEYPGAKGLNPLSLWNLHWVKELDDGGFIDSLVDRLST
jgi:ABC-type nitrate/sulfonate/bicarbonate transport system substrate-binding protein